MARTKRKNVSWRELRDEVEYQLKNGYPVNLIDKYIHSHKVTSEKTVKPQQNSKGKKQ